MDNKNWGELKESFRQLQEGLVIFEKFLDTVKQNIGDVRLGVGVLIEDIQQAERGKDKPGMIQGMLSHFKKGRK